MYHLTEVPQFVSGRHVVWFDPHATSLPGVNPANPGKMVDFRKSPALLAKYPDQFAPLEVFRDRARQRTPAHPHLARRGLGAGS